MLSHGDYVLLEEKLMEEKQKETIGASSPIREHKNNL